MPIEKNESKLLQSDEVKPEDQVTKPKSFKWFELILYPQDNQTNHNKDLMDWLTKTPYICSRYVYILHDRDVKEDGEHKKDHIHFLAEFTEKYTTKGLFKMLVYLNDEQIKPVGKLRMAMLYLTHDTPESNHDGKTHYDVSELRGNQSLINDRIIQNKNYAQNLIFDAIRNVHYTIDVFDEFNTYSEQTSLMLKEEFMKHPAFYQQIAREERERERYRLRHYRQTDQGIFFVADDGQIKRLEEIFSGERDNK